MSDPLQGLTGDAAGAVLLRRSLTALADRLGDAPLGALVREVLAGRRDVRELADDPEFDAFTREGMEVFTAEWDALAPDDRAEALRAGEAYLGELAPEDHT